jgi:UDP-glucuronate 4-epimerase
MNSQKVLVTGAAGFIGFHLSKALALSGFTVAGIDNINDYYDVGLKHARLDILKEIPSFKFHKVDLTDRPAMEKIFVDGTFDCVINLAAQAGVRYSLVNPQAYLDSNIAGFLNVLECCRHGKIRHLIYASSSSVYGANRKMPFSVHHNVDHPLSLYAASKKSNELMAHSYASLFALPSTGLRFFSAYGPFGRPDMALFIFTKAILEGSTIDVYNQGRMKRDFTYVDDIVEAIKRLIPKIPQPSAQWNPLEPDPAISFAPYRIYNVGNNNPVELRYFIEVIENALGRKARKNLMPMQEGDVPESAANVDDLVRDVDFNPSTSIEAGVGKFIEWYLEYYKIKS